MSFVRSAYVFTPTAISNCVLWLDGADSSTVTGTTSVTAWTDKSGNAYNGTVVNASVGSPVAPSYLTNSINGLSAMTMSGTSYFTGSTNVNSTTLTAFFLGNCVFGTGGSSQQRILGLGVTGLDDYSSTLRPIPLSVISGGTQLLAYRNANMASATVVSGTNFIGCCLFDGTSNYMYKDGTLGTQVASSGTFTTSIYGVGSDAGTQFMGGTSSLGTNCLVGKIGELIVYNTALNTSQRQQVESYLAQKWGLTTSLIGGHPGLNKIIHRNLQTTFTKKQYFTAFSPRQIGGCALWFDATDSSTITLSSGSLTQWNDKSGNGRNLTAVFANATVSSAYQNGLNVFNFSGNALYRTAADTAVYPQDVYIIIALKSTTAHVDVLGVGATNTGNFNSLTFGEYTASRWHNGSDYYNRTPNCISPTNETSTSFLLIQWSIANGNYLIRRNGTQLVQTATYSWTLPAGSIFQIGYRHPDNNGVNFSGYIGEIIVFNNQIGTTDRQRVESYLAQKWGLVSSLPAGHLNATFPAGSPTAIQAFIPSIKTSLTNIAKAIGGIITNVGSRRFHTFINNGTFSIIFAMPGKTFEVFAIGGGGGGGGFQGGGGGGGGLVTYTSSLSVGNYSITIGTGGIGGTASSVAGGNGTSTLFSSLVTAIGGGGGGSSFGGSPSNGGCGGGGAYNQSYGTGSQGFNGTVSSPSLFWGGGGGGTSASATNNNGGAGTLYYGNNYGGGGGGGGNQGPNGTGGIGGGGDGGGSGSPSAQYITPAPIAGAANTGGGGGGHGYNGTTGAIGGTGICIVSYIYP